MTDSFLIMSYLVSSLICNELRESSISMPTANLFFLLVSLSTTPLTIIHVWHWKNKNRLSQEHINHSQVNVWIFSPTFSSVYWWTNRRLMGNERTDRFTASCQQKSLRHMWICGWVIKIPAKPNRNGLFWMVEKQKLSLLYTYTSMSNFKK